MGTSQVEMPQIAGALQWLKYVFITNTGQHLLWVSPFVNPTADYDFLRT